MTLIKLSFQSILRTLSNDISKRLASSAEMQSASQQVVEGLLYTRFLAPADEIAPLLALLERRATEEPEDVPSTTGAAAAGGVGKAPLATQRMMTRTTRKQRRKDPRRGMYKDDLGNLMNECYTAYLSTRRALVIPRVREEIRVLDVGGGDLVELVSANRIFLLQTFLFYFFSLSFLFSYFYGPPRFPSSIVSFVSHFWYL
jgi:conserved oligomeric Golgi complex subunit 3